uniref:50S ribosomal protein L29 n=1 Tax=Syphacia muris TaxID=451379 RepID=A0A0N5AZN4_9BILA
MRGGMILKTELRKLESRLKKIYISMEAKRKGNERRRELRKAMIRRLVKKKNECVRIADELTNELLFME